MIEGVDPSRVKRTVLDPQPQPETKDRPYRTFEQRAAYLKENQNGRN